MSASLISYSIQLFGTNKQIKFYTKLHSKPFFQIHSLLSRGDGLAYCLYDTRDNLVPVDSTPVLLGHTDSSTTYTLMMKSAPPVSSIIDTPFPFFDCVYYDGKMDRFSNGDTGGCTDW